VEDAPGQEEQEECEQGLMVGVMWRGSMKI
jgi:hypothetical protein